MPSIATLAVAALMTIVGSAPQPMLRLSAPVHHLDVLAREPMVVEHSPGVLFVAGYGSQVTGTDFEAPPHLWKTTDGGEHWRRVDVGTSAAGAAGNSDVDLAVGPDGTVYFLVMGFNRSTREGTHIAVGVSHDVGESWTWHRLSETRFDDRPWVAVAPDGTAHVIWNDDQGVSYAAGRDGGRRWEERPRIHDAGGSSHLAVGPAGEIAVRITPIAASANRFAEGVDLIAVSTDGGVSWTRRDAPGDRVWSRNLGDPSVLPRWVEPIAWDAAGALYSLWSEGSLVRLARSADHGETWNTWTLSAGEEPAYFPYLTARRAGELAATWFSGLEQGLVANLVSVNVPETAGDAPRVRRAEPFQIDAWSEVATSPARTPAGEYIPVVILSDGRLGVATPIQDLARDRWGFSWWTTE